MSPISIEFEASDAELMEAVREIPMLENLRAAALLWTIFSVGLVGHQFFTMKEGAWPWIALVICVAGLFWGLYDFLRRKAIATAKQAPRRVQLRIDATKITAWSPNGAVSLQWSEVRSTRENKLLFAVIPNDAQVVFLPKRILSEETQEWLRAHKKRQRAARA